MTKYLSNAPFTSGANSKAYVDNWERMFGKKDTDPGLDSEQMQEVVALIESAIEEQDDE